MMSDDFDYRRRQLLTGGIFPFGKNNELPEAEDPLDRQASHFERYSKKAMACEFELLLNLHQYRNAAQSALEAFSILDSVEDQMSIYRDSSELSLVNRNAATMAKMVDDRLFEVLLMAKDIHAATGGAFDITALPLTRVWGFHQRQGLVPPETEIRRALDNVGMDDVKLDPDSKSVQFASEGMELDLGGIGKGFAIDLAADCLAACGINDFVLQGGQSSVATAGRNIEVSESGDESGWKIGLSHPQTPNCRLAEFELRNQKLGTSGSQRQGFFYQGRRFGHIIDPRTGYPTDHCLSATVICESAAQADALATAFFVMQPDEVESFCEQNSHISAILVYPQRTSGINLEAFNCGGLEWTKLC